MNTVILPQVQVVQQQDWVSDWDEGWKAYHDGVSRHSMFSTEARKGWDDAAYADKCTLESFENNGVIHKPASDTYLAGWKDYEAGYYWPLPPESPHYGEYIKGWNDAWAKAEGVVLVR